MCDEYPKFEMCNCGTGLLHGKILLKKDVILLQPFHSKQTGLKILMLAKTRLLLSQDKIEAFQEQIKESNLLETEEDTWKAYLNIWDELSEEDQESLRRQGKVRGFPFPEKKELKN